MELITLWAADPDKNAGCDGEASQLQFDCFNWRSGLEHGDTGRDMFALTSICLLQKRMVAVISQDIGYAWINRKERMVSKCRLLYLEVLWGEGHADENPIKPRALSPPMSLRGAILLFDEGSLLDCKQI